MASARIKVAALTGTARNNHVLSILQSSTRLSVACLEDGESAVGVQTDVSTLSDCPILFACVDPSSTLTAVRPYAAYRGVVVAINTLGDAHSELTAMFPSRLVHLVCIPRAPPARHQIYLSGEKRLTVFKALEGAGVDLHDVDLPISQTMQIAQLLDAYTQAAVALSLNVRAMAQKLNIVEELEGLIRASDPISPVSIPMHVLGGGGDLDAAAALFRGASLPAEFFSASAQVLGKISTISQPTVNEAVSLVQHNGVLPAKQERAAQPASSTDPTQSTEPRKKLKVLCLHGWRTSGDIMKIQLRHFPKDLLEMHFIDAANKASG